MEFLIEYGPWGMLLSAFLAGSFFPFSSEAVMLGLLAAGSDGWELIAFGTVGNVLGSVFNYGVGRMGKTEWFEQWLKVKPEKMEQARRFIGTRGAYMGFFAFIPILGSAITILLGLMRANFLITIASITVGKFLRYWLLVYGAEWIASLF